MEYYRDLFCKWANKVVEYFDLDKRGRAGVEEQKPVVVERINMNLMAKLVASSDKGREESSISQIKEILRIFLEFLAMYDDEQILEVVKRYKKED